jgi:hypothetical protein
MHAVVLTPTLEATHLLRRRDRVTILVRRGWEDALPLDEMLAGAALQEPRILCP